MKKYFVAMGILMLLMAESRAMDRSESINYAIKNNPTVIAMQKKASAAKARLNQATSAFFPTASLNGNIDKSYASPATVQLPQSMVVPQPSSVAHGGGTHAQSRQTAPGEQSGSATHAQGRGVVRGRPCRQQLRAQGCQGRRLGGIRRRRDRGRGQGQHNQHKCRHDSHDPVRRSRCWSNPRRPSTPAGKITAEVQIATPGRAAGEASAVLSIASTGPRSTSTARW